MTERLVRLLGRRLTRRRALSRVALGAAAFAVAPIRYLVRPGTAWAVIGPGNCGSGLCTDGYTAFCCEIEHGLNRCPDGTYVAGWWKCTSYQGAGLCHKEGVRYYTRLKTVTARWPTGIRAGAEYIMPTMR